MVKEREYVFSVNQFNEPVVKTKQEAIGLLLIRLIMLNPGSDPLHPDMGVGIQKFRYTMGTLPKLRQRVEDQIATYLPMFNSAKVELTVTPDKLCNIKISIDNNIYIYDSSEAAIPITIDDLKDIS